MGANSSDFPWPSYYGEHAFLKKVMWGNNKVTDIIEVEKAVYDIERSYGDTIRIFVCECYSFGAAEYEEAMTNLKDINAIIIDSNWCNYTGDAKIMAYSDGVGLFKIVEFMHQARLRNYLEPTEDEKEMYKAHGII